MVLSVADNGGRRWVNGGARKASATRFKELQDSIKEG